MLENLAQKQKKPQSRQPNLVMEDPRMVHRGKKAVKLDRLQKIEPSQIKFNKPKTPQAAPMQAMQGSQG